jgi:hypothetical protein
MSNNINIIFCPLRQIRLSFFNILIANESKEFLNKNGIFISTPTLKSPLFNYAAFCKVLCINRIVDNVHPLLSPNLDFSTAGTQFGTFKKPV